MQREENDLKRNVDLKALLKELDIFYVEFDQSVMS